MIFDILVLAALLISAVIAFFRGFIREILTILGVVGGLAAAYFGGPALSPVVRGWFGDGGNEGEGDTAARLFGLIPYDMAADAISYGAIFIVVVIVLSVASHLLSGWAKAIGLGAVDRTFGVIFGLVRAVVILALLYLPVSLFFDRETRDGWFGDSRTYVYVDTTAGWMLALVPDSWRTQAQTAAEETADDAVRTTREKLQEMDILGGGQTPALAPRDQNDTGGYETDQRRDLNALIEEGQQQADEPQDGYNE